MKLSTNTYLKMNYYGEETLWNWTKVILHFCNLNFSWKKVVTCWVTFKVIEAVLKAEKGPIKVDVWK